MDKKEVKTTREKHEAEIASIRKRHRAEIARKNYETVAITVNVMMGSKNPELCQSDIEDLMKIAFNIINWEDSNASTICEDDIENLKKTSPQFGVLNERNGRKIYGFFNCNGQNSTIIKKLVDPLYSGAFQYKEIVPLIEKHFSLTPIHRKKTK